MFFFLSVQCSWQIESNTFLLGNIIGDSLSNSPQQRRNGGISASEPSKKLTPEHFLWRNDFENSQVANTLKFEWKPVQKPLAYRQFVSSNNLKVNEVSNGKTNIHHSRPQFQSFNDLETHVLNLDNSIFDVLDPSKQDNVLFKVNESFSTDVIFPITSEPVFEFQSEDQFPPNGYGLYDMAGNVWEI